MLPVCIDKGIMLGVATLGFAEEVSKAAVKLGKTAKLHIKLDTGMNRVGFRPGVSPIDDIVTVSKLPNIELDGVFSHLAESDKDNDFSPLQFKRYLRVLDELQERGITFAHRHIANSGGILAGHKYNLDLVRAGIILYGQPASEDYDLRALGIQPFLTLKSFISYLKTVPAGTPIGYSRTYTTERETVVATIPIGYADGYSRDYSNRASVLIGGRRAQIMGRVCMDLIMVDVTNIPGVKTGDEVVLLGKQGSEEISATELARIQNTIEYEVLTSISARVARVYVN
jgi:alanine racemase